MKYIDISSHQGAVDFEALKDHVDGVMIRAGYGKGNIDPQFRRSATECKKYGIPCGAYWFSYAYTVDMAEEEAKCFLNVVKNYEFELPLAFDYDYDSFSYGKKQGANMIKSLVKDLTVKFMQTVGKAGYYCMLQANNDFIGRFYSDIIDTIDLWFTQAPIVVDLTNPPRDCGIWQWGQINVPGIVGKVNVNEAYKDYATLLRYNGFNHLPKKPEPFVDHTAWYFSTMKWAEENGICDSKEPESFVTKAEVAQMLFNYHKRYDDQ